MTKFQDEIPANAIYSPEGGLIVLNGLTTAQRCAALIQERLGYSVEIYCIGTGMKMYCVLAPDDGYVQHTLSALEREAVSTLAWYCHEYGDGLKKGESYTLPAIVLSPDSNGEGAFSDEGRAFQFAAVIEHCFTVSAQVASTAHGWQVIVNSKDAHISGKDLANLQGACTVLMNYPIGRADNVFLATDIYDPTPCPEVRESWYGRADDQNERIENGINRILEILTDREGLKHSIARGCELLESIGTCALE